MHAARSRCITHTHRVQPQRRQGVQPGVATRVGSANFSNRHIADATQRKAKGEREKNKRERACYVRPRSKWQPREF